MEEGRGLHGWGQRPRRQRHLFIRLSGFGSRALQLTEVALWSLDFSSILEGKTGGVKGWGKRG